MMKWQIEDNLLIDWISYVSYTVIGARFLKQLIWSVAYFNCTIDCVHCKYADLLFTYR